MRTFTDSKSRTWSIHIDVNTIRRVKALVGVDLLLAIEGKLLHELAENPIMMVDTLFAVCQPQAQASGITDIEFAEALVGDAIDLALTALMEDLVAFFPKGKRQVLAALQINLNRVYQARTDLSMKRMEAIDLEKAIDKAIAETDADGEPLNAGASSTNSPASPASTPAR